MADPKIKYDIEAAVKGEANVEQLAAAVRGLGEALDGDLKKQADDAANALEALGAKQSAVETFARLKRETADLGVALSQSTSKVDALGNELPQATAATLAFADAEGRARAAVNGAETELNEMRAALTQLRTQYTGAARGSDEYKEASAQLRSTITDLRGNLKEKQAELQGTVASTRTAQQAEKALSTEYTNAISASRQLSSELGSKNRALDATRVALRNAGIETTNLSQTEKNLQTAVAGVKQQVLTLAPAFQAAAAASSSSARTQVASQNSVRDSVQSLQKQLQQIQQIATVALGGSYVGGLIKDVAATADEFKNLQARIGLVAGQGEGFQQAFAGVTRVALATNSALESTGTLFARLAKSGTDAGLSTLKAQDQALALTQTINQAVQLSGSSAEASNAAVTQLIQGLQSGVLRGEEFNSVMEQAPRLAQALADGLGRTTGELRKMANEGQLTTQVVIKALRGQSDAIAGEFSKLPATVGRALQNLSTQWTLYVGSADAGLVSSSNVAKVIGFLGNNLDTLVTSLTAAGKLWAAIKVGGLASDFGAWAARTLTATQATEANSAAVVVNTKAQQGNTAALAQNAVAQNAASAAAASGTATRTANAAAWQSVGVFTAQATAATAGATAAMQAGTVAAVGKTASLGLLGTAVRGVTGLLGGPVGLAVTVALFSGEIKRGAVNLGEWIASLGEAGRQTKRYEESMRQEAVAQKAAADAAKDRAAAIAAQTQKLEDARNASFELSRAAVDLSAKFDKLRTDGDSAAEAIGKIGKDFDLSRVEGIKNAGAVLDKLLADGKLTADEFRNAWANALDGKDLAVFETQARAAFRGSAREGELLAALVDSTLREAVKRAGADFDTLGGGIGRASRSAINDVDAIVGSLDRLKQIGADTGLLLSQSLSKAINTADSQAAIDTLRARIESLRKELGDRVTDGLLDQVGQQADKVKDKIDQLKGGINSTAEAMKFFGLQSQESLQRVANESFSAYDAIRNSGQTSAEAIRQAFMRTAADAIAANKGIVPGWVEAEAAVRGVVIRTDEFGRVTVEAAERAGRALGGVADAYRNVGQSAADAAQQVKNLDEINSRYGQGAADREGKYDRPSGGSVTGNNREERLAGQNAVDNSLAFNVRDKLRKRTLGVQDVGDIDAVIAALNQQEVINRDLDRINPGGISVEGLKDRQEWRAVRTQLQQISSNLKSGGASNGASSPIRRFEISVNNGSKKTIRTADEESSSGLEDLMRELESAKRSSGR